jgi:hypothetical protein
MLSSLGLTYHKTQMGLSRAQHGSWPIKLMCKVNWSSFISTLQFASSKKKNPVNKNQGWKPIHQKYKVNENTSRHNPKKKQKQTINKNQVKTLCNEDSWL